MTVYLPASEESVVVRPEPDVVIDEGSAVFRPETDTPSPAAGCEILVIDDETGVRDVTRIFLEQEGFAVTTANDGMTGLEIVRQRAASLCAVVVDLTMPELRGDRVAARIRKLVPGLPVILMSGYGEDATAAARSVDGFVGKPFNGGQLVGELRRVGVVSKRGPAPPMPNV